MADELKIYDEITHEEIRDPDLERGYLYDGRIQVGMTEESSEIMEGTISERNPEGLKRIIPAKDIYEDCQYYHKYTEEEKKTYLNEKLSSLSNSCNEQITKGIEITLSDESKKTFSYSIEDQANISEMFNAIVMGATSYPYHANGEGCKMYSAEDIVKIYSALTALKTSQVTYYNQLREYVKTLEFVPDIQSIVYGQELTGSYLDTYNELMQNATTEMQKILSRVSTLMS